MIRVNLIAERKVAKKKFAFPIEQQLTTVCGAIVVAGVLVWLFTHLLAFGVIAAIVAFIFSMLSGISGGGNNWTSRGGMGRGGFGGWGGGGFGGGVQTGASRV